jgi:hypothetical protein
LRCCYELAARAAPAWYVPFAGPALAPQERTRAILNSLFPSWLPGAFKAMFSGPLPAFSCKLNALATALSCQWLMGPCKVNDVELDDGSVRRPAGPPQGRAASAAAARLGRRVACWRRWCSAGRMWSWGRK